LTLTLGALLTEVQDLVFLHVGVVFRERLGKRV
jgi:hypothetical protein